MRIYLKVQPGSSQEKIEKVSDAEYKAWLTARPIKNEANVALVKLLAKHFGVSKSQVMIVAGKTAKEKIIDIQG